MPESYQFAFDLSIVRYCVPSLKESFVSRRISGKSCGFRGGFLEVSAHTLRCSRVSRIVAVARVVACGVRSFVLDFWFFERLSVVVDSVARSCGRSFLVRPCLNPSLRGVTRTCFDVRIRAHFARHLSNLFDHPRTHGPLHNQENAWLQQPSQGDTSSWPGAVGPAIVDSGSTPSHRSSIGSRIKVGFVLEFDSLSGGQGNGGNRPERRVRARR